MLTRVAKISFPRCKVTDLVAVSTDKSRLLHTLLIPACFHHHPCKGHEQPANRQTLFLLCGHHAASFLLALPMIVCGCS